MCPASHSISSGYKTMKDTLPNSGVGKDPTMPSMLFNTNSALTLFHKNLESIY